MGVGIAAMFWAPWFPVTTVGWKVSIVLMAPLRFVMTVGAMRVLWYVVTLGIEFFCQAGDNAV